MKNLLIQKFTPTILWQKFTFLAASLLIMAGLLGAAPVQAACAAPATNLGSVTSTVNVPAAGTYQVWSRIMAPDTTNNTYMLEVDGGNCYVVGGGSGIPAKSWTWVDYQNGATTSPIGISLTAGSHTLKMIGNAPGVKLDRIILTGDTTCVPTNIVDPTTKAMPGDNCANPPDKTPPTVSLTAPKSGAAVSGKVPMTATASDDSGTVSKVEFYANNVLEGTSTTSPYSFTLDTTTLANGSNSLTAKAYDPTGNVGTSTPVTVTVNNASSTPPAAIPTVAITAPADGGTVSGTVKATATATANVPITKVAFSVDGTAETTVQTAPYTYSLDTTTLTNGTHSISFAATDSAGTSTDSVSVTVQNADKQAPSVPAGVTAKATAYNNVNLSWTASTDNVGVTGYNVLRNGVTVAQLGAVTSYSDTTVGASTQYQYQVIARDAAGNMSAASAVTTASTATTPAAPVTTPAPVAPTGLSATPASPSQINLSWTASTSTGVTGYDVYRSVGTATATKVTTVTTTSFGDTNLSASTAYKYYVITDVGTTHSPASTTVTATTLATPPPQTTTGVITGVVSGSRGRVLSGARVILSVSGNSQTYSTNSTGAYTIPGLPVGSYSVRYRDRGYTSRSYTITVTAGQTITKNVTLRRN